MKRRIAVIGLGAAARKIHLPACAGIQGLEVVGGCDPEVASEAFPFPVFRAAEEMLSRLCPDLVSVVTPPETHAELACLALNAGCHVFCEKPFAINLAEADRIIALANDVGRRVVVNNQYRYMDIHRESRRRIGSAEFGELLFLDVRQSLFEDHLQPGWRSEGDRHTCQEFGTHVFDLCRFLFDSEPISIHARMPKPNSTDGRDRLNLIQLEFPGDRVAQITLDRLARRPTHYLSLRLDGTTGCIETEIGGKLDFRLGVRGGTRRPYCEFNIAGGGSAWLFHNRRRRRIASEPLDLFVRSTRRLLQELLRAIDAGVNPPLSAEDNRRTLAAMLAAYESHAQGRPITLI